MEKWGIIVTFLAVLLVMFSGCGEKGNASMTSENNYITLPEPQKDSDTSIEEALQARRSIRSFNNKPVTVEQLSRLLWAAQGITDPSGKRTAPSAGALYPLKLYAVIGNVNGLEAGIYFYEPGPHSMTLITGGDRRQDLTEAALNQLSVKQAAIDIVITAVYEITTVKYGERGVRYVHLEAGHAAQNICLQAVGLKLGTVTIGAFDDAGIQKVLGLPEDEIPLYIIPAGNFID